MDVQIFVTLDAACVTPAVSPFVAMALAQLVVQRSRLILNGVDYPVLPEQGQGSEYVAFVHGVKQGLDVGKA